MICPHGFSFGYCPTGCRNIVYWDDLVRERRQSIMDISREGQDVSQESVIIALQNIHQAQKYIHGTPRNIITPEFLRLLNVRS